MTDTGQVPGEGLPEGAGNGVPSGPAQGMGAQQPGVPAPGAYSFADSVDSAAPADPSAPAESPADDDDLLLMPGAQGAWSEAQAASAAAQGQLPGHGQSPGHGRQPGQGAGPAQAAQPAQAVQPTHVAEPAHAVEAPHATEPAHQPGPHETSGRDSGSVDLNGVRMPDGTSASSHPGPPRRPLHHGPTGPAVPDGTGSPVRSLADRGPAGAPSVQHAAPARHAGPPTGPEYLDIPRDAAGQPLPGPQPGEIPPQGAEPWGAPQADEVAPAAPAETVVPEAAEAAEVTEAPGLAEAPELAEASEAPTAPDAPNAAVAPEAAATTETPHAPHAPDVTPAPQAPDAVSAELPSEAVAGAPAEEREEQAPDHAPGHVQEADAPVAYAPEAAAFPNAADFGQVPMGEQQFPADEQQFAPGDPQFPVDGAQFAPGDHQVQVPAGEQPAFAYAGPTGAGQPAFAVASAQPWDGAQAPYADGMPHPGYAPDAAPNAHATPHAPEGYPAEARHAAPGPQQPEPQFPQNPQDSQVPYVPQDTAAPLNGHAAPAHGEPGLTQEPAPVGQFVPVDGSVPTTPHLAPTPPHPVAVPQEDPATPEAAEALEADAPAADPADATPVPVPPTDTDTDTADAPAQDIPEPAALTPEALAPEDPATADLTPDAAQQPAVTVPAPRDGAEPAVAPVAEPIPAPDAEGVASVDEPGLPTVEAAAEAAPEAAEAPQGPDGSAVPRIVSSAAVVTGFPAAPQTADPADELDEADDVISFEPIEANEVTEVAEAPEMAEAPEAPLPAPGTPEAPEALAPVAAPDVPQADDARHAPEVPEPLVAAAPEAPEFLTVAEAPGETDAELVEPAVSAGTAAPGYADAEREAVLRVMRERRDIRNGFRADPIPHEVLLRVLEAAHTAPSVGHSQPWDFVVIKSAETRRTMHELAARQRDAYAKSLPKGRAKQFKELKIEAILDTPVNIVVTADPTRGGRHTLGRHTQPQMAPYSSALAVENLWLAARAEGLGVGWVSFFDEREMVRTLGLPEHLEVVAYLCVGYVDEFPDEPELMQAGWSKRRPLSWVVHEETYGRRALPGEDPHDLLAETVANIRPLDAKALGEAWERQKRMTKPPGALGMLEIISAQLSGLSRMCPPPIPEPAAVAIFAGDHGVHAQGVTAWPQEVTAQMVANFLGGGAVCNAFANQVGAEVCVIDVGVASELPATPGLLPRKVRAGTADMTTGPALTREEVKAAVEVGIETARDLVAAGNKALLTGEMGIANTTASAALISVYTEVDPAEVTGRGTGINDEMHTRKVEVVRRALELHRPDPADPIGVLAAIGGLEHAAMVGLLLGGASLRTPVILDGVSAGAAALVARAIAPEVLAACIAGHRSAEPGHVAALNKLGLRPLVDLDLRLGEGTGALLALPVVQSAARAMHEVATFDSAGVTEK
ncbi:nicotinate-nucleotide--dimethylbenzimidazole phosphoribosyltransferase [Streptomyces sp. NPDC048518]|uniref:nicotinate-nucleotide--dimethylbenzimidazole phosphoribosyltransferase n=1 Tax=Streptomyces sp. NPDC048518 TaxID=3155029 RepID=UPI0033F8BB74